VDKYAGGLMKQASSNNKVASTNKVEQLRERQRNFNIAVRRKRICTRLVRVLARIGDVAPEKNPGDRNGKGESGWKGNVVPEQVESRSRPGDSRV